MRQKLMWVLAGGAVVVGATAFVGSALATPAIGFVGTTIAFGRLAAFDVENYLVSDTPGHSRPKSHPKKDLWLSVQRTKGDSDLYVQSNVWAPGGSTGWHTHPGHSLITVTAGTLTAYEGDDPACTPTAYTVGMSFADPGGDHVHVLRNETAAETRTITVQLIPAGATRRIDAEPNAGCGF
jgi:hypothetical protein